MMEIQFMDVNSMMEKDKPVINNNDEKKNRIAMT
jgi:hypothetical protein